MSSSFTAAQNTVCVYLWYSLPLSLSLSIEMTSCTHIEWVGGVIEAIYWFCQPDDRMDSELDKEREKEADWDRDRWKAAVKWMLKVKIEMDPLSPSLALFLIIGINRIHTPSCWRWRRRGENIVKKLLKPVQTDWLTDWLQLNRPTVANQH